MKLFIDPYDQRPIYEQIMIQLKSQILSEKLERGCPLPSIRALAKELRVSVITTKRAYDELEKEGLLYSAAGKGTFVAAANPDLLRQEQAREIEALIKKAVETARVYGISPGELIGMIEKIQEEER